MNDVAFNVYQIIISHPLVHDYLDDLSLGTRPIFGIILPAVSPFPNLD